MQQLFIMKVVGKIVIYVYIVDANSSFSCYKLNVQI